MSNNSIPMDELSALSEAVHAAVKGLASGGEPTPVANAPANPGSIDHKSITPDCLICLDARAARHNAPVPGLDLYNIASAFRNSRRKFQPKNGSDGSKETP